MRGLSASVAVSLGAHLALGAGLLLLSWRPPPPRRDTVRLVARLSPVHEPSPVVAEVPSPSPAALTPPEPAVRPRRPSPPSAAPTVVAPVIAAVPVASPGGPAVDTVAGALDEETPRERAERLRRLLDPARVASAIVASESEGPILPSGPAGLAAAGETVVPLSEREAEARHEGVLGAAAAERPELHETAFVLHPHADGTLTWTSPNFTATIHADGRVSFSDRPAFEVDLEHATATFDVNDLIHQAAGSDPFAADREHFFEEAWDVILERTMAAREAERERVLRRIPVRCARIWADETVPAAERRARLFALWDDLSEEEADRPARDAVLAFIHESLPSGSPNAFTASELGALNAARVSVERFAP